MRANDLVLTVFDDLLITSRVRATRIVALASITLGTLISGYLLG